ncbi:MAG: glutaminyl-peptide cyclotransferase [Pirellulaceae bacterium]|nr:glutaminyl-peptide cyclotransferase [Pirellulaceae bacterium]
MFRKPWWLIVPLVSLVALAFSFRHYDTADGHQSSPIMLRAEVIAAYAHDPNDFCQGLAIEDETVYESTGQYGSSKLKKYDLRGGTPPTEISLPPQFFGEGICLFEERIYQLTWKERVCFVYDKQTLRSTGRIGFTGQGWGLTTNGKQLFMSDGSATIQVLDPATLKPLRRINVTYGRKRQDRLNELEFVGQELWACIWYEDRIARIEPTSGQIKGWIDCSALYPAAGRDREHVLNGIAYDAQSNRLFVTGKNWPKIFELTPPPQ